MLRNLKDRIGAFFYIDAAVSFVNWIELLGAALFGALMLIVAIRQGNSQLIVVAAGIMAIALATLGLFGWIFRDAKMSGAALRQKRQPPKETDSDWLCRKEPLARESSSCG